MLKAITLEVIGAQRLHCEACERRVERLLTALQGVRQVRAHAHNQRIEVLFDTAVLESTALAARLGEAGYDTHISS
jgi:copper chaperone